MLRGAVLGVIAGAAIATLPGRAGVVAAVAGALAGGVAGWRFASGRAGF